MYYHFITSKWSKGAFTPDANEALRTNDLHVKSMQRRDRQSCGAFRANEVARNERFGRLTRYSRELKNLDFGGYSRLIYCGCMWVPGAV